MAQYTTNCVLKAKTANLFQWTLELKVKLFLSLVEESLKVLLRVKKK